MRSKRILQQIKLILVLLCILLTAHCGQIPDIPVATTEQEMELYSVYKKYLTHRKRAFLDGDISQLELVTGGYELERIYRAIAGDLSVKWESDAWDIEIRRFEVRKYSEIEAEVYALDVHDYEARKWDPSIVAFSKIDGEWKVVSHSPVHFD